MLRTLPVALLAVAACAETPLTDETVHIPVSATIPVSEWAEHCEAWDDWDAPSPPFAITPEITYVGTCGITSLLVATTGGYVLFDTGTEAGAEHVLATLRDLGVDPADVSHILTSHEHFDHVGGLATVQAATGADVVAGEAAARVLATGRDHPDDPQYGMHAPMRPVAVATTLADGEVLMVGDTAFRMVATPGHTPGAVSWSWRDPSGRDVVYADSLSPVSRDGYRFAEHLAYLASYRGGLERLAQLPCDLLLTPHPSSSAMIIRAAESFAPDPDACTDYAARIAQRVDSRLEAEASP